jgi:hypothetical protein
VFESRTVWVSVGYAAELHSHAKEICAKKALVCVMFTVMFLSNLIRSKENDRQRKLIRTGASSGCRR